MKCVQMFYDAGNPLSQSAVSDKSAQIFVHCCHLVVLFRTDILSPMSQGSLVIKLVIMKLCFNYHLLICSTFSKKILQSHRIHAAHHGARPHVDKCYKLHIWVIKYWMNIHHLFPPNFGNHTVASDFPQTGTGINRTFLNDLTCPLREASEGNGSLYILGGGNIAWRLELPSPQLVSQWKSHFPIRWWCNVLSLVISQGPSTVEEGSGDMLMLPF